MRQVYILFFILPFFASAQLGTNNDTTLKKKSKLYFYRPYKFESSLAPFTIIITDVQTKKMHTHEIKNKGTVEIDVSEITDLELTVSGTSRRFVYGVILRPGDTHYFKVELKKHLPALTRMDPVTGRADYEQLVK